MLRGPQVPDIVLKAPFICMDPGVGLGGGGSRDRDSNVGDPWRPSGNAALQTLRPKRTNRRQSLTHEKRCGVVGDALEFGSGVQQPSYCGVHQKRALGASPPPQFLAMRGTQRKRPVCLVMAGASAFSVLD